MKRNIKNPEKWIGKKLNRNSWNMPDGYNLCAKTDKFYAESDLERSFGHTFFDRQWLIDRSIYIEDADWLSEEGYFEIMDVLKAEGVYEAYLNR